MRKRYRILLLAIIVAALVVPVGFALSLESPAAVKPPLSYAAVVPTAQAASFTATTMVTVRSAEPRSPSRPVADGTKLFLVGTILVGLAAAVRRAV
jgi:hypothetical protein